jgi:hypothetical protein
VCKEKERPGNIINLLKILKALLFWREKNNLGFAVFLNYASARTNSK